MTGQEIAPDATQQTEQEHQPPHGPCTCDEVERPDSLRCEVGHPSAAPCNPDSEISIRKQQLDAAEDQQARLQAEIDRRTKAIAYLEARVQEFDAAMTRHAGDSGPRGVRRKECDDFYRCHPPNICDDDRECVDRALEKYDDTIEQFRNYIRSIICKAGNARIVAETAAYELELAEWRFKAVLDQATGCLGGCKELAEKSEGAKEAGNACLEYLYWRSLGDSLQEAEECCLTAETYRQCLCSAYAALASAATTHEEALSQQEAFESELALVKKELTEFEADRWLLLETYVATCCCQPRSEGSDESPTPAEEDQECPESGSPATSTPESGCYDPKPGR